VPLPSGGTLSLQLTSARTEAILDAYARRLDYIPGEVIVKFKPGMAPDQEERALSAVRSRPTLDRLRWIGDAAVLTDVTQPNAQILADQLSTQPEVEYATPNYLIRLEHQQYPDVKPLGIGVGRPALIPTDSDYSLRQWNFKNIQMQTAWDVNPGGSSDIIVAVVDTGVTTSAQSFTFPLWNGASIQNFSLPYMPSPDITNTRFVSPRDFVFAAPGGAVLDMEGHGTHVASTIAEDTNNALALAGIAYKVRIMPVKVCLGYWDIMIQRGMAGTPGFISIDAGSCPIDAIASGIRYAADNGAKVINISLGGTGSQPTVRDAIAYAVGKGAFVSISMGNDFEDGNPTQFPSSYAPAIDGAMSVAAVGPSNARAYYSSTGSYCEIAAPGGNAREGGSAAEVWQVTLSPGANNPLLIQPRFDVYAEVAFQGTSMAAPHVAGVAALIMSQSPGISPAAVERLIRSTALDLGPAGKDDSFGYGLVQARTAVYGFGIIK
jgi:serine protease